MSDYQSPPHNEPELLSLLETGDVALDIGANVGAWSYELLQKYKTVHGIEPQIECHGDLRALQLAYPDRYIIHQWAAWLNKGELLMQVRRNSGMSNICGIGELEGRGAQMNEYSVRCQPCDCLQITEPRVVDFIKIDTEGAEIQVLLGLQVVLCRWHPSLLVEYHAAENRDWCMAWLKRRGYAPRDIPINEQLGWIHAKRPN